MVWSSFNEMASESCETDLVQVVCPVGQSVVDIDDDALNFVTTCPLHITRMSVDPSHVLANLRVNRFKQEIIDRVQRVRKNEL